MQSALEIQRTGRFEISSGLGHCLGQGIYFAARRKAERFAHDYGGSMPALLRCSIYVDNPICTQGDCRDWQALGYDSCRAEWTSKSSNPEWCIASSENIKIIEVIDLKGFPRPRD